MAVVQMQKVVVITHKDRQEELLHFLQEQGVMEVSETRDSVTVDHTEVRFRAAELEFAIATLKESADKDTLAAMRKAEASATEEKVKHAATHVDVLGIVEKLHALDKEDQALSRMAKGLPAQSHDTSAEHEQSAYFTGNVKENMSKIGHGTDVEAEPSENEKVERMQAEKQLEKNRSLRQELSKELPNLVLLRRYLRWLNDRQAVREAMQHTKKTVMLMGWLPKDRFEHIENKLHKAMPASALLRVKAEHGEHPPVKLHNNKYLTPFESVTTLYGLPKYDEMDPTPFLALFFIFFFALCLTDAGYGMVQALVMGGVLWKTKKTVNESPLFWLLFVSGIVTVLVSIPFGGWFGLLPTQVPSMFTVDTNGDGVADLFKGQIWNLGDQSGITFLQNLSLALGIIHLSFGIMLGAYSKAKQGSIAAGLWSDGTSLVFVGTTLLYFFGPESMQQIFKYSIFASLALMVWGKGYGHTMVKRPLMGLLMTLNFFLGMMGNVLSYLRILALGLVTGALAFTVNLVATQVGDFLPWYLAIPVTVVICVVGHTMSIVLNILGAFIHSGRLQFVEFFGQFFEGGGRSFKPFTRA